MCVFLIDYIFFIKVGVWVAICQICPIINIRGSFITKILEETVANQPPEIQELSLVHEGHVSVSHSRRFWPIRVSHWARGLLVNCCREQALSTMQGPSGISAVRVRKPVMASPRHMSQLRTLPS